MSLAYIYDTGTLSVAANATAVTGVGTAWQANGIMSGDTVLIAGLQAIVASVTDNTHLTLTKGYKGSTQSGATYEIIKNSPERDQVRTAQRQITEFINTINGIGVIHPVASGGAPDPDLGEDGQYALDFELGKYWKKVGGVWTGPHYYGTPGDADYLVKTANAGLSAERVVTDTATIVWDWSTAGQARATVVAGSVGPSDADYLVKTANGNLSAERVVTDNSVWGGIVWDWATAGQAKGRLYGVTTYVAGSLGYSDSNFGFMYRPPQAGAVAAHRWDNYAGTELMHLDEAGELHVHGKITIVGDLAHSQAALNLSGAVNASAQGSGIVIGAGLSLTATANNDVLAALRLAPTYVPGAFTGVTKYAIYSNRDEYSYFAGKVGIKTFTPVCELDVVGAIRVGSYTVATLPAASLGAGMIAYVTDANATTQNSVAAGGGANKVLVFSDATNWRIA